VKIPEAGAVAVLYAAPFNVMVMVAPGANVHVALTVVVPPTETDWLNEQLVLATVVGGYVAPAGKTEVVMRNAEPASRATADAIPTRIFASLNSRMWFPL
jgi:hypothetical protein